MFLDTHNFFYFPGEDPPPALHVGGYSIPPGVQPRAPPPPQNEILDTPMVVHLPKRGINNVGKGLNKSFARINMTNKQSVLFIVIGKLFFISNKDHVKEELEKIACRLGVCVEILKQSGVIIEILKQSGVINNQIICQMIKCMLLQLHDEIWILRTK